MRCASGDQARVSLRPSNEGVEIMVEDDGQGIPEADRDRVFDPFVRLEGSRNRDTGGVGLGLSIARSIVRSHGGEITLSQAGAGLRVHTAFAGNARRRRRRPRIFDLLSRSTGWSHRSVVRLAENAGNALGEGLSAHYGTHGGSVHGAGVFSGEPMSRRCRGGCSASCRRRSCRGTARSSRGGEFPRR